MFEVRCYDEKNKSEFVKVFWNRTKCNSFINKCNYSKIIKVLSVIDNSKYYD